MGRIKARLSALAHQTWERTPRPLQRAGLVGWRTIRFYSQDQCSAFAAAIAYYAAFSVIPLGLLILAISGFVFEQEQVVDWVFDQFPLEDSASVRESVNEIVQRSRDLRGVGLGFGILSLAWSASGFFGAVRRGLDATHMEGEGRPFWKGKLIDLALVPGVGLLLMSLITTTAALRVIGEWLGRELGFDTTGGLQLALFAVGLLTTFGVFTLLYRFVPSHPPRWSSAMAGAAGAAVLLEVFRNILSVVLAQQLFSRDTALYAGFGTALAFLFVVFIVASIVLLGAEFARALGSVHSDLVAESRQPAFVARLARLGRGLRPQRRL